MRTATGIGPAVAGVLLLSAAPVMAQVKAGSQEVHVYAGQLFGDDVTDSQVSGGTPKLDDGIVGGVRYGYNFTESLGGEVAVGYNRNSITGVAGGDTDVDLWMTDINAVWHFNPRSRFVPYVTSGAGWATAELDRPIQGTAAGQPVSIEGGDGFTLNGGVGAKYFATDRVVVRFDTRYRYLDAVVDNHDNSLNTFETTLGVGWRF
jgi:outer membrane beta-barrel protein